ncbi:MAG: MarR family transcriptional regulator [Actinomycetota bacterium]|nr:MarR family transcriptional regulator [Actinomycetota bacterium]
MTNDDTAPNGARRPPSPRSARTSAAGHGTWTVRAGTGEGEVALDPVLDAYENWRRSGWDGGAHFTAALSILATEDLIRRANTSALHPHRLTHARHEALALIYFSRNGELPLNKLSTRLMVHPTSTTSTVDTLERLDLAERIAHPSDRRTTLARITPAGRAAIEATCAAMTSDRFGLSTLSSTDARALFDLLEPLRRPHPHPTDHDGPGANEAEPVDPGWVDPVLRAYENWRRSGWDGGAHFTAALSILATEDLIRRANTTALHPHRLTHARHEALALIYFSRNGELPLNKLSTRLMVHPTSTTSTVDTLERLDLAERIAHPSDRRTTLARITPAGRAAIEATCAAMTSDRFGLSTLSSTDARALFDLLEPLRRPHPHPTDQDPTDST